MWKRRKLWRRALAIAALAVAAALLWLLLIPSEGVRFAMDMGPGWNLANTLDAYGLGRNAGDTSVYERYWGGEPVSQALIDAVAGAGFRTLRVPVTWFEHMDENLRVDAAWLARVKTVVDMGLAAGMRVIVNAHHDPWYEPNPVKREASLATMRTVWGQIATAFVAYDERLLFEGMNEPRLLGHREEWTTGTAEARDCLNALNEMFVRTVRQCGGYNATRYLLIPAYAAGVSQEALGALRVPNDRRVMVSAHVYLPYDFTLNEQGTADWSPDAPEDMRGIRDAFDRLWALFVSRGVPVVVTEFGAVNKGNEAARANWAAAVTRLGRESGIPCLWWGTSLLEKTSHTWRYPALLTALVR